MPEHTLTFGHGGPCVECDSPHRWGERCAPPEDTEDLVTPGPHGVDTERCPQFYDVCRCAPAEDAPDCTEETPDAD